MSAASAPIRAVAPALRAVYAPPIGRRGASCLDAGGGMTCRRALAGRDEELLAMLARLAASPPPPTQFWRRTYPGRSGGGLPPARGVAGDLPAALREVRNRESVTARAARGGGR